MPDPYASHLPILKAVLATYEPKRVLELGTGPHSTSLFLNADVELTSLETDENWASKVEGHGDLRVVEDIATNLPPLDYDLVFVDDSDDLRKREATIRAVLSQDHPLTVIHDAEVFEYAYAIRELSQGLFCCVLTPHTAICYPLGYPRRYDELLTAINQELATDET